MSEGIEAQPLSGAFQNVADRPTRTRRKSPPPFSVRFSDEERAVLKTKANGQPLGAYIRARSLGDQEDKRRSRRPKPDHQALGLVLAALGHSHLASNMNQIAKSLNMGSLDVTPEVVGAQILDFWVFMGVSCLFSHNLT
jgi:hypothetical protein